MVGKKLHCRIAIAAMGLLLISVDRVNAELIVGLTANTPTGGPQLILFDSAAPGVPLGASLVTGLGPEFLLAIDFRPATGELFGLSNQNRLYTVDLSGAATLVTGEAAFTVDGDEIGMDFNPTVDRIRVVTDNRQNLRLNPNAGAAGLAATDTPLAYALTDVNAGQTPQVIGAAYTNSFAGATSTTLYVIDDELDILVRQDPPNAGTLNTVGSLGDIVEDQPAGLSGFDISGNTGTAYLVGGVLLTGLADRLYTVNLTTGAATAVGIIASPGQIVDIAVVPEPAAFATIASGAICLMVRRRRD